jgi:hypothetical protein
MIQAYNKKMIRGVLYDLKKKWGASLTWHIFIASARNLTTGTITSSYTQITVSRAILLPVTLQAITYNALGFKTNLEIDTKYVIVDTKDLTSTYANREPDLRDYIIINGIKYKPSKPEFFEHGLAVSIRLKA